MTPAQHAKKHLMASLQHLTDSAYVRIREASHRLDGRYETDFPSEQVLSILSRPHTDFSPVVRLEHAQIFYDLSLVSAQHIQIDVQAIKAKGLSQKENRRELERDTSKSPSFSLDFVSLDGFDEKFITFVKTGVLNEASMQALLQMINGILQCIELFREYQKFTQDNLTKLQSRNALQSAIDNKIEYADMILCLVHCRDFQVVNRKFGQAKGDQVLNEIATILSQQTRSEDIACRFGGALFGVASYADSIEEGKRLATKLQQALHARPYLKNAVRLSFNFGVAAFSHKDLAPDDSSASSILISRAEQALRAAQTSDKPSVVIWELDKFNHDEQDFNYLGGIFTPDNVTNYRNMLLLWDITSIIADEHSFSKLLYNVIERLGYTFEFSYAGILSATGNASHDFAVSVANINDIKNLPLNDLPFIHALKDFRIKTVSSNQPEEFTLDSLTFLLVPLGSENKECFFIVGETDRFHLTHDSSMLFAGFARQIGKALRRSQLEEQLSRKLEHQNAILSQELEELKSGLKSSALVYKSEIMQGLMTQAQRAAQTDTTVLITGESGTGKERLINAVHSLSSRSAKPPVIVDCGSIPETLIESELFGHTKGAFTGAQSDKTGKILAANKGILVLDEIGELPLLMQPKLLRFVQEKHFTPVGSTKPIKVDVKIIAVTNRDLLTEVKKGKFREDLYYRLNVVRLHNPPLRERLDDLDILCQHFLTKFSRQYDVDRKFISADTLQMMKQYSWPGNIRQLENVLMQACLLSQANEINFAELNIEFNDEHHLQNEIHKTAQEKPRVSTQDLHQSIAKAAVDSVVDSLKSKVNNQAISVDTDHWSNQVQQALADLIDDIESSNEYYHLNVGDLLEGFIFNYLVKTTRSNKEIAEIVGLPISTARRKANKYINYKLPDNLPSNWAHVVSLLERWLVNQVQLKAPLHFLKNSLARAVLQNISSNMTRAAALVGVSEPTLYKIKREQLNN